ncbi:DMT family transporter [Aestuariibius sp. HNIBRBA575]|uniref:DMT family transporter n=1 Tax=Aestuariibius sp. HNIBRBA575 TaxID=3233343 RepID=UPI0034A5A2EA
MSRPNNGAVAGHVAMLAFSALVAGSFALGGLVANEIAPMAITSLRFLLASTLVGIAALVMGKLHRRDARAPWRYGVLGGLIASYMVLMFEGLKTAPPVSAAAVFTLTPAIAALFGWIVLRQITTGRMALAITIGGLGAIWVIFRADIPAILAFQIGKGEMIYFVGCVAHAVYAALIPRLNRGEAPVTFTFGTLVMGTLIVAGFGWSDIMATQWGNLPMIVWITLGYITVFATAATFVLIQFAALRLPAAKVMAYTYLVPSWVILWEIALGGALPPVAILAGLGLIVMALLLLLRNDSDVSPQAILSPETAQTLPD